MTLYWWTHWFWITCISLTAISSHPLSSFDTISTSLKSSSSIVKSAALIQNDNSFQKPADDQNKLEQIKQHPIMTSLEVDADDVFDGGGMIGGHGEFDTSNANKFDASWLSKGPANLEESHPVLTSVKLTNAEKVPPELLSVLTLSNAKNSTNATSIITNNFNVTTTTPSSVTEVIAASSAVNATTTQSTKLRKLEDHEIKAIDFERLTSEDQAPKENEIFNSTADSNLNDYNETEEILLTDDFNVTEVAEISERRSKVLTEYNEVKLINNISSRSTLHVSHENNDKLSSEALFVTDEDNGGVMNAGAITAICVGVLAALSMLSVGSVYVYRRRFLNKPQTLGEQDSSGYIDDSTIRDNSDEMYSLDNDSFLNSLEAMTIQNYWTDSVKHTKL